MNIRLIRRVLGLLLIMLSFSMLAPTVVAWYFQREQVSGFLYSIIITAGCGLVLARVKPHQQKLRIKESILIVMLCWVLFGLFGALPYYICGVFSFTDAVFETVSGFTTTGSSVLVDIEGTGRAILFWRSLTQWLGGMGIVVLSLAIMPFLGSHGYNLYKAETTGLSADKLMPRLQTTAKILWFVYVFLSLVFIIALKVAGMDWFDAICHSFTGLSTGGFSTKAMGIAFYDSPAIDWIVAAMALLGGVNFFLHYRLMLFKDISSLVRNRELLAYLIIITAASVAMAANLSLSGTYAIADSIRLAFLHVINHITTTGYTHTDFLNWPQLSQTILIATMFIGGCAGSTAGGPKVIRVIVLVKAAMAEIKKVVHSSAVIKLRVGPSPIKEEVVSQVLGFFVLFAFLLIVSSLALSAMGMDVMSAFSASLATVTNTGPGFGSVGPYANFFLVPEAGKWLLIFNMIAGRLELYTAFVLLTVWFWRE